MAYPASEALRYGLDFIARELLEEVWYGERGLLESKHHRCFLPLPCRFVWLPRLIHVGIKSIQPSSDGSDPWIKLPDTIRGHGHDVGPENEISAKLNSGLGKRAE